MIDDSVVAKWFLNDEELTDAAAKVLASFLSDEIELHAPIILQYELANALTKAQRHGARPIDAEICLEAYRTFSEYPIVFHHLDEADRLAALDFANRHRRSFFDSAYLGLAIKLGCRWLTAEQRFKSNLPVDFSLKYFLSLDTL